MEDQDAHEPFLEFGRTLDIPEDELTPPPAADESALLAAIEERWIVAQDDLNATYSRARAIEQKQKQWKDPWPRGPEERIRTVTETVEKWRAYFRAYLGPESGPAAAEAVARIEASLDATLAEWTKPKPAR